MARESNVAFESLEHCAMLSRPKSRTLARRLQRQTASSYSLSWLSLMIFNAWLFENVWKIIFHSSSVFLLILLFFTTKRIALQLVARGSKPRENRYAVVPASQGSCGGRERRWRKESLREPEKEGANSVDWESKERKKEFTASSDKSGRGRRAESDR